MLRLVSKLGYYQHDTVEWPILNTSTKYYIMAIGQNLAYCLFLVGVRKVRHTMEKGIATL